MISKENSRESTCHLVNPQLLFYFELHIVVSVLTSKTQNMSSVSDSLLGMKQEKVLKFQRCMLRNLPTCSISKAQTNTWSVLEAASPHALPAQHPGCHRHLVYLLLLLNTSGSFLTSEQVVSPFDAHLLSWEAMQSFSQLIFTKSIVISPQTNPPV